MIYPTYRDLLLSRQRQQELIQAAEHERLLRAAGLRQPVHRLWRRQAVGWLGNQLVHLGSRLQHYGDTPAVTARQL